MTRAHVLENYEGPLRTKIGACFPGERAVFRGHDLHSTFRDAHWLDLYVFGITGWRPSPGQLKVLEGVWVYTSYPDARLWNNRVAALTGSTRSTGVLGVSAALAVSEATIYGRQAGYAAAVFLQHAQQQVASGLSIHAVLKTVLDNKKHISGYGRPIRPLDVDERIPVLMKLAKDHGWADGPHLKLAFQIEEVLLGLGKALRMNYAAMVAALLLDMGFSIREHYLFMLPAFLAGMVPCYLDAIDRPEGATFPLRCDQLHYDGPARRQW